MLTIAPDSEINLRRVALSSIDSLLATTNPAINSKNQWLKLA